SVHDASFPDPLEISGHDPGCYPCRWNRAIADGSQGNQSALLSVDRTFPRPDRDPACAQHFFQRKRTGRLLSRRSARLLSPDANGFARLGKLFRRAKKLKRANPFRRWKIGAGRWGMEAWSLELGACSREQD